MNNIYCISGLGADYRLFKNLAIHGYNVVPLPWVPHTKDDTMSTYAMKMAAQIKEENPIILGLSLGGMLTTEIVRQMPVKKAFLISSAKTKNELGYSNDILRWVSKKDLVPSFMFNDPNFLQLHFLGAHTTEEKEFLRQIIRDADPVFVRWAINMLLHWESTTYPQGLIHIHGTDDKVIRSKNVRPTHWLEGGSHIMIYNRAAEVNKIIADCLTHANFTVSNTI